MPDIYRHIGSQEEYPPRPRGDDGAQLPDDEPVPFVRPPSGPASGPAGGPAAGALAPPASRSEGGSPIDARVGTAPVARAVTTLLVANRGEIARRIMATARLMGLRTVAVYSEPDRRAPHVGEADVAVALGGSTAIETYLNVDKILDAARATGADAIHPGYGFLSENASFAQTCADAGLTFVGPTPDNIRAMGGKIEAKRLAEAVGVPTLPSAPIVGEDTDDWAHAAAAVGYPLLVKASAGGGGKGMRIVASASDLSEAIIGARREALSSFGDGTVFVERYLRGPRHIEIQVFVDRYGRAVHLHERECSIQRRHQKIVEEAPSPAVDADMRRRLGEASLALVRSIEYLGAGTVEYLLDDAGSFYFLEMNTRLQVEHRVTEAVTGTDLVRWQLEVAMGRPLPLSQADIALQGHAIEVRLYAEDPANGFLPTFGTLEKYQHPPAHAGLQFDDGVVSGNEVSTYYDPMLAKVIAHAPTRAEAAAVLANALRASEIHGLTTNRDYLVELLGDGDFRAGRTSTDFVETHEALLLSGPSDDVRRRHVAAAIIVGAAQRRSCDGLWSFAPSGWRNLVSQRQVIAYQSGAHTYTSKYVVSADSFTVDVNGVDLVGRVLTCSADATAPDEAVIVLELADGRAHRYGVRIRAERTWVNSADGQTELVEIPRFPVRLGIEAAAGPMAPVPGRVVAVAVSAGDRVDANQLLVVMEAMKMEHRIEAAMASVVREVLVSVGDQVDAHQVLVHLDPVDPVGPVGPVDG